MKVIVNDKVKTIKEHENIEGYDVYYLTDGTSVGKKQIKFVSDEIIHNKICDELEKKFTVWYKENLKLGFEKVYQEHKRNQKRKNFFSKIKSKLSVFLKSSSFFSGPVFLPKTNRL